MLASGRAWRGKFSWWQHFGRRVCWARPALRPRIRTSGATCLVNSFFSSESLYLTFDQESKCAELTTLGLTPPPASAAAAAFTGGILDRAGSAGAGGQRRPGCLSPILLTSCPAPSPACAHPANSRTCCAFRSCLMHYTYSYLQLPRPGHVRPSALCVAERFCCGLTVPPIRDSTNVVSLKASPNLN